MRNKLIIIIAIIIALVGTVIFWQQKLKKDKLSDDKEAAESAIQIPSINGVPVSEKIGNQRPIAVVVENHPDARPQSGLTHADIVYETLAEAGITRFLAFYQTQEPKEIGPIRSARPYFAFLANQWGASFAHVGGSDVALREISSGKYPKLMDINEFFYGSTFVRNKDRSAPHNTYTTVQKLRDLMDKKDASDWTPVKLGADFKTIPTQELQTTITKITAKFFDPVYTANFTFDPSTGLYLRGTGTKNAIDKNNNTQISPRNVLIQFVDDYTVPLVEKDTTGIDLKLDRSGSAILFTGGTKVNGKWNFAEGTARYQTNDNQPMQFQPGQTWIILMPKSLSANVKWE
jgi:hypothetical protein